MELSASFLCSCTCLCNHPQHISQPPSYAMMSDSEDYLNSLGVHSNSGMSSVQIEIDLIQPRNRVPHPMAQIQVIQWNLLTMHFWVNLQGFSAAAGCCAGLRWVLCPGSCIDNEWVLLHEACVALISVINLKLI